MPLFHPRPSEELIFADNGETPVIASDQYLPPDFWQDLEDAKEDFRIRLDGYTPVASIPEGLVNKWIREGFDFWNAPANEIVKKLKLEEYSAFVISGDTTFDH